jgi:phosphoribosylformylglycinamidine (FGAM) synthase PurS component
MCQKLLVNTVIENYRIDLAPEPQGAARK